MAKTKMTGFARLLIFLIFVLPLAFFGASYINGEDPMQKFKDFTGMGNGNTPTERQETSTNDNRASEEQALKNRILQLERDLAIANEKLARCQTAGVE